MALKRREEIRSLWLQFRVASQFAEIWERAEANVALIRMREQTDSLPTQDDIGLVQLTPTRGGSPAHWMQMCGVKGERIPKWFTRDHLGIGTGVNFFDTQRTLRETNARRAIRHRKQLERLADARKVLARRVTG